MVTSGGSLWGAPPIGIIVCILRVMQCKHVWVHQDVIDHVSQGLRVYVVIVTRTQRHFATNPYYV